MKPILFNTSDFYSAVILRTYGFPLSEISPETSGSRRMVFRFDPGNIKMTPDEVLSMHWDGELELNTKKMIESINELKTRVFDKS